eukprot:TRINITY_DN9761_c0_g1_i1.p1 TRINITY_DN9761_c0_g1~~TRINITY_DN9761_c0_g1_i1.p1  ORF type:complete len:978 (+),score=113.74 TRINITY_DN9761_c0_g1_i1:76-3009(+)
MSLSLRLIAICTTWFVVIASCLTIGGIIYHNAVESEALLTRDATNAINSLTRVLMHQFTDSAAASVKWYLTAPSQVADVQARLLRLLGFTSLPQDSVSRQFWLKFIRSFVEAFPQITTVGWMQPDGKAIIVRSRNETLFAVDSVLGNDAKSFLTVFQTERGGLDFFQSTTRKVTVRWDPREEATFKICRTSQINTPVETTLSYSLSGLAIDGLVGSSVAYALDSEHLDVCIGVATSTSVISGHLTELARATGSVLFLVDATGKLLGSSHGSVVKQAGNQLQPVSALESDEPRVAFAYARCDQVSEVEVTFAGTRYLCASRDVSYSGGFHMRLFAFTPRSTFFADIERSAASAAATRRQALRVTIGICALVLAVCLVWAIIIAVLITRPLARLVRQMQAVADMDLEDSDTDHDSAPFRSLRRVVLGRFSIGGASTATSASLERRALAKLSVISEIRAIQDSFHEMKMRLREYKAFIPAPVFDSEHPQGFDDLDAEVKNDSFPGSTVHSSDSTKLARTAASAQQRRSSTPSAPGSLLTPNRRFINMDSGLTQRHATVLCVDTDGFHQRVECEPLRDVVRLHTLFLEAVLGAAQRNRGAVDGFQGDHVVVTWNTFLAKAQHCAAACKTAVEIHRSVLGINVAPLALGPSSGLEGNEPLAPLVVRIGVTSGKVAVGRLGSELSRALAVVGPIVSQSYLLAKHARTCQVGVLADHTVYDAAKGSAEFRPVDIIEWIGSLTERPPARRRASSAAAAVVVPVATPTAVQAPAASEALPGAPFTPRSAQHPGLQEFRGGTLPSLDHSQSASVCQKPLIIPWAKNEFPISPTLLVSGNNPLTTPPSPNSPCALRQVPEKPLSTPPASNTDGAPSGPGFFGNGKPAAVSPEAVRPRLVYELLGEVTGEEGEWMYVLDAREQARENEQFQQTLACILRRDFEAAAAALAVNGNQAPNPPRASGPFQYFRERAQQMIAGGAILSARLGW